MTDHRLRQTVRELQAQVFAHDMILRGLMTAWAQETADPRDFIVRAIEGLISSLDELRGPVSGIEGQLQDMAADELRQFGEQVALRLRNIAAGNLRPPRRV